MAVEAGASADVDGARAGGFVGLADHWLLYIIVLTLAVLVTKHLLYYLCVSQGWTGGAAFFS